MNPLPETKRQLLVPRFGLADLLHFTTLTGVLCALTPALGMASAIGLWLLTLALAARQGWLALIVLAATVVLAGGSGGSRGQSPDVIRQFAVVGIAMLLCWICRASEALALWYRVRDGVLLLQR